ncbi:MAG: DUF262 domain-containing protein [Muribaculaceae bacterium]|nr:DUF262 domain-containing protein [Muribaculaceae bacterium]
MEKDNNITYSLLSLLNGNVDLDAKTQVPLSALVIPRIQRPYAQGRTDDHSTYVRQTFLNELFECLIEKKECDLNFIYGIVASKGTDYVLELLDGQQRLTTLFLLYWYITCAELQDSTEESDRVRNLLRKFVYETRTTATLFCHKLANFSFSYKNGQKPSECLRNVKWYFKSFDRDSTVCAMLNTLDDIHNRYIKAERHDLFDSLEHIRFYVKSLGVFNLSEELYIKMNARGLQLSPFENFKADLINFIANSDYPAFKQKVTLFKKGIDELVTFDFNFSVKLDAKWVDLFWKKESEEFDDSMMSFFTRFFSCRFIVDSASDISDKDMRSDKTIAALYTNSEANIGTKQYLGFKIFEDILSKNPENILLLDKVLDILYDYDLTDKHIYKRMLPVWEKTNPEMGDDFYCNAATKNTHVKMIALGATIAFIEHIPNFNPEDYNKWMRVVWNIIENTNIDGLQPMASLIRKFDAMATWIGQCLKDKTATFYSALSIYSKADSTEKENRAIVEEVEKARRIAENPDWEDLFIEAENHPFFKGMVTFFYSPTMNLEDFRHAYKNAAMMFDAKGISPEFRTNHILIRAIVSCLYTWNEINQQYITERAETNKYLKNLLASNERVRQVIVSAASATDLEGIKLSLQASIDNAPAPKVWPAATHDQEWGFHYAIETLRNKSKIYDWMAENEERNKKVFRVYWYNGHIMLAQPRQQYAKIALDTERAQIAAQLVKEFNFQYNDENQKSMFQAIGDVFGNDIRLLKEYNKYILWIGFLGDHKLIVEVTAPSKSQAQKLAQKYEDVQILEDNPRTIVFPELEHWKYKRDYAKLTDYLRKIDIETTLQNLS